MATQRKTKYVHEGKYVAAVRVDLILDDSGWSPYLSEDAYRLDQVRGDALKKGDLKKAAEVGQLYELHPIAA